MKNPHGGYRENANRKPTYKEQTKTLSFRVPISKMAEIDEMVKNKLNEYKL